MVRMERIERFDPPDDMPVEFLNGLRGAVDAGWTKEQILTIGKLVIGIVRGLEWFGNKEATLDRMSSLLCSMDGDFKNTKEQIELRERVKAIRKNLELRKKEVTK